MKSAAELENEIEYNNYLLENGRLSTDDYCDLEKENDELKMKLSNLSPPK